MDAQEYFDREMENNWCMGDTKEAIMNAKIMTDLYVNTEVIEQTEKEKNRKG